MSAASRSPSPGEAFDIVHARILRFFPELVSELGGEPASLLVQADLPARFFDEDGQSTATYRQIVHLIELAATALACPDFGLRLATRQHGTGMFGPLGEVMRNSDTFGDALTYVHQHAYAHSLAARIWSKRTDGMMFYGHDILIDASPSKSQAMEQILLLGHLAAMEMTGGHARVRKVHFRHQPVSTLDVYRRYFRCEVKFGQDADGVFYKDRDLKCPIVAPDARSYASATSFIDNQFLRHAPPLRAQTRGLIMHLLNTDTCTNEHVAAELGLHPRTLHRRLKSEGTTFQDIKDEIRRDMLLYYLRETALDFAQISAKLGFAEQSVMTRRCQHWFGLSPTKVRAQAKTVAAH